MTLLPHPTRGRFVKHDGPEYGRDVQCANPLCGRKAEESHHVWSRAHVGATDWIVDTHNGHVLPNLLGVCSDCHRDLTGDLGGHKAKIVYCEDDVSYVWVNLRNMEGATIESFEDGPVVEENPLKRADWLRAQGRDEDADALLGDAA